MARYTDGGASSRVDILHSAELEPSPDLTYLLWTNITSVALNTDKGVMTKSHSSHSQPYYNIHLNYNPGINKFSMYAVVGNWDADSTQVTQDVESSWHVLAGSFDETDMKIYIDSVEKVSFGNAGTINWSGQEIQIGNWANLGRGLQGDFSHACVYSSVLTTNQQLIIFKGVNPFVVDHDNLQMLVQLDGNGTYDGDYSGNGNYGEAFTAIKSTTNPPVEMIENYL